MFKCLSLARSSPQFSFLVLGRHLDDSWFVDDSSGAGSLLNNSDDPSLVPLLLFNVFTECRSLFSWQRNQQPTCKLNISIKFTRSNSTRVVKLRKKTIHMKSFRIKNFNKIGYQKFLPNVPVKGRTYCHKPC